MKNGKYEFVQRIERHYVGDDCIQIMSPYYLNRGTTLLNSSGMIYHYKPNSNLFINKYTSDERKNQFPYSQIPNHKSRVKFKKMEYVNQLLDFNRVYIEIANGVIKENYAIKDGDEALVATKFIIPNKEMPKFMSRNEVLELLKTANGGIFSLDGGYLQNYTFPTEERILEIHKEHIIEERKEEQNFYGNLNENLTEFFYNSVDKLTIDDVPKDITILKDEILVSIENNEIKSIKAIVIKFMGSNNYKVESYNFPITIYTLDHMKKLEQTNVVKTQEPKFPMNLNKTINKDDIRKSKQLILEKNK